MIRARSVAPLLILVALAAAPAAAQEPDRGTRPPIGPVPELELPPVQRFSLDNGLEVLLVEKHDLPLVQVDLHVRAGSVRDLPDGLGLASLTADMLDEGAAGRSALEIADAFELLGARFTIGAGLHLATLSLRVPVARLPAALGLISDVALRPDFPDPELDRLRQERITALIRRHDQPNAIAGALFTRTLYGPKHPYGRSTLGDAAALESFTTADLRAFHRSFYRAGNAAVVVVGDVDAATIRARLASAFGGWEPGTAPPETVPAASQVTGRTVYLVDKPGAAQSVIQIGRIGVPRTTEDYYALQVLNTILGGSFTSRLNQNLREDKGYTYGARSSFDFRPAPGPFTASAAVQTDATGAALREFMKELRAIREPIPQHEIALARKFLAMRYPAGFQSVAGIVSRLADIVESRLPSDILSSYTGRILAVSRTDVERAARQYIDPEKLAIVVVGDRQSVEERLRAAQIGEIRFLEVDDVLGPAPQSSAIGNGPPAPPRR